MDEAAFEGFAAARWGSMTRAAVLMGCSRSEAEDAVQTALIKCFVHWGRISRADRPDAYAYRVLINTIKAEHRKRYRSTEMSSAEPPDIAVADATDATDARDLMWDALSRLAKNQREVLVLRYYSQFTEAQTADVLGVRIGTVKSRSARGLRQLAQDPSMLDIRQGRI